MTLKWGPFALSDREDIFDYIAADSPRAAAKVDDRIEAEVDRLLTAPKIGRPGRIPGTREMVIAHTPYIAAYRVERDTITVLRVLHGVRQWPDAVQSGSPELL